MKCINCNSIDIGRIGTRQYYCWNCCIEMTIEEDGRMDVFQVEKDGSLSSLNDLFLEEETQPDEPAETAEFSPDDGQRLSG
ncbi:hypothetical protein [Paenibacillus methanolicus]|uniref:Uncharacterized protein n=1 Tax=Paenibacillus methanolicus TaxID=582686 RepID=A0A5S5BTS8_9BACL|nr:hypothetical protein [Paenibacillus methanolicus]TYP69550.1 hypothetical protein BCM02_11466 [Paenibacillus methanolicus]